MTRAGDLRKAHEVTGQTETDVTAYGCNRCSTRMASTMTRTDTTDEGATILAGGSKKDGGVAVRRTAVAYL
jgi:hypothetical protein